MDREIRRGTLPIVILSVIARGPTYGYDLTQTLEQESAGLLKIKEGTLYPILYRFEEAALIEPRWDLPGRGTPRKYYELTEKGARELQQKISDWKETVKAVEKIIGGRENEGQTD